MRARWPPGLPGGSGVCVKSRFSSYGASRFPAASRPGFRAVLRGAAGFCAAFARAVGFCAAAFCGASPRAAGFCAAEVFPDAAMHTPFPLAARSHACQMRPGRPGPDPGPGPGDAATRHLAQRRGSTLPG